MRLRARPSPRRAALPDRISESRNSMCWPNAWATALCHNVRMLDEHHLTLRQIDLARSDFYAISDDLDLLKAQLARLRTRKEVARLFLLATLTTAALVLVGIEALFR